MPTSASPAIGRIPNPIRMWQCRKFVDWTSYGQTGKSPNITSYGNKPSQNKRKHLSLSSAFCGFIFPIESNKSTGLIDDSEVNALVSCPSEIQRPAVGASVMFGVGHCIAHCRRGRFFVSETSPIQLTTRTIGWPMPEGKSSSSNC